MPARFRTIVVMEGIDAGDDASWRRRIGVGALTARALPLTMMGMTRTAPGHDGAEVVGSLTSLERVLFTDEVDAATGQTWGAVAGGEVWAWVGEGVFDDRPEAADVEQLVRDQHLRGVSVDLAATMSEIEVVAEDEDGFPTEILDTLTAGEIAAATVCNTPAFRGCTIELVDDDADAGTEVDGDVVDAIAASAGPWLPAFRIINDGPGCEPCTTDPDRATLVAAAGPEFPPAAWFTADLPGPTPLTITDDGRVFGHLATWGTCHVGFSGQCVTPPRSRTGYALFRLGAVRTAEGEDVAVGHATLGTGHAALSADLSAALAHYDDTGTVVADLAAGDDAHGVWVAGAMRPDATPEQVRAFRSASLSGDWRRHGGALELVAALAVNVPGFPVPRTRSLAASGVPVSLVAAGAQAVPARTPDAAAVVREAFRLERARDRASSRLRARLERVSR